MQSRTSGEDYKNGAEIIHNGKNYILYDNKWLEIESVEAYDERISNRGNSRRPPMRRGGREIAMYMRKKALPSMLEGAGVNAASGLSIDKFLNAKLSAPAAILSGLIGWTYNGYKVYYETSNSMEAHDKKVKK